MNLKRKHIIILLALTSLGMAACQKEDATGSSVSEQDIQQAQVTENSSQLKVHDVDNQQQIMFQTMESYRTLDAKGLEKYNNQYQSFKTMKYFYNDDKDISVAVAKVSPLTKSKDMYFTDLEAKVKKAFPGADYSKGSNKGQYDYAAYSYRDEKNKLNNSCNVIISVDGKTIYSICAISSTKSIPFLKETVKNITVKTVNK